MSLLSICAMIDAGGGRLTKGNNSVVTVQLSTETIRHDFATHHLELSFRLSPKRPVVSKGLSPLEIPAISKRRQSLLVQNP